MEAGSQEKQVQRRDSWAQYADCKDMSRFGDLGTPEKTRQIFNNVEGQIQDKNKRKRKQGIVLPNIIFGRSLGPPLFIPPGPQFSSKNFCSLRYDLETPGDTPCPSRSLDDLYLENPGKKLQVSIDPKTMNVAAGVVLHVATESGYQWFNKWCPHMDFHEVFESIGINGGGGELADKKCNVPPDAINTQSMKTAHATTLAELYRRCQNIDPKDPGDFGFPKLLKLIDQCTIFVSALKDSERKILLEKLRSEFQWIPIALDKERVRIINEARGNLEALNGQLSCGAAASEVDIRALNCKRKAGEHDILNATTADFDVQRNTFESLILEKLEVLLASTARSPPKSN